MSFEFFQIPVTGGDAAEALNRSLRGGRITSVRREFVAAGENSFWAFCVDRVEAPGQAGARGSGGSSTRERVDYKEVLPPEEFAVFSRLRELRKTLAEKEAVPAYSVFTNEQLAQIVREKPGSLAALGKVPGVGEAKVKKYGEAVLEQLASQPKASEDA